MTASKINYGISNILARKLGCKCAKALNKTILKSHEGNKCAGIDCIKGFMKRNLLLSLRNLEPTC